MKFAICNELYKNWPLKQAFTHARNLGYTGIEIAPFTIAQSAYDISQGDRARIRDLAEACEIEVVGLHWLFAQTTGYHLTSNDPHVRSETARYLEELARLCRDLGGNILVFGSPAQRNLPPGVSPQQGFDRAVATFQTIAPVLEACDVVLALEPLGPEEGNFMLTAQSAIEIAQAVGSTHVKLHLDVKAMATETKPIPDIIRSSRQWLVHFHANDPNRQGPGMGDVDFRPIMQALKEIGYGRWVSVEVFDESPGIETLARKSIECLQQFA